MTAKNRKFRSARDYRRRRPSRDPYDFVLIVCEGAKTEPNYFRRLRASWNLSSANINIAPPSVGNDPVSIVRFAEGELRRLNYDRAYCVFDRNGHAGYKDALRYIEHSDLGKADRLIAIPSVPCFEVWILLHFRFSNSPFEGAGGVSSCDLVIRAIKEHFRDYTKGREDVFDRLEGLIETALTNAERLVQQNSRSGSENPETKIHDLVNYLRQLKGN